MGEEIKSSIWFSCSKPWRYGISHTISISICMMSTIYTCKLIFLLWRKIVFHMAKQTDILRFYSNTLKKKKKTPLIELLNTGIISVFCFRLREKTNHKTHQFFRYSQKLFVAFVLYCLFNEMILLYIRLITDSKSHSPWKKSQLNIPKILKSRQKNPYIKQCRSTNNSGNGRAWAKHCTFLYLSTTWRFHRHLLSPLLWVSPSKTHHTGYSACRFHFSKRKGKQQFPPIIII